MELGDAPAIPVAIDFDHGSNVSGATLMVLGSTKLPHPKRLAVVGSHCFPAPASGSGVACGRMKARTSPLRRGNEIAQRVARTHRTGSAVRARLSGGYRVDPAPPTSWSVRRRDTLQHPSIAPLMPPVRPDYDEIKAVVRHKRARALPAGRFLKVRMAMSRTAARCRLSAHFARCRTDRVRSLPANRSRARRRSLQ